MGRRVQGTDIILRRGPAEEFSMGLVYRALRRLWRRSPFYIGSLLNIMGGSVYRELCDIVERGIWKGAISLSLSLSGSSLRGTWRAGSFTKGPEGYERKALGMGISLHGGSFGQPGVGSATGDFEIWLKGALEVECLSLWELCEGNLEGGLPSWGS